MNTKPKLFIMKGIPTSGKSTFAKKLAEQHNAVILSSDAIGEDIREEYSANTSEVFMIMEKRARKLLKQGWNVIIDSTNLSKKRVQPWTTIARKLKIPAVLVFVNTLGEQLEENIKKRAEGRWSRIPENIIREKVYSLLTSLNVPTNLDLIDELIVVQKEITVEKKSFWKEYFTSNEEFLINEPERFMVEFYEKGYMNEVLPELVTAMSHYQDKTHHDLSVFDHMLKAAQNVTKKDLKMIWALLLHDIGKINPFVKTYVGRFLEDYKQGFVASSKGVLVPIKIVNGKYIYQGEIIPKNIMYSDEQYHYYGHPNFSAMMAYEMLNRLGYDMQFIKDVATLILYHMNLPHIDLSLLEPNEIRRYSDRYGKELYEELKIIREADLLGK